MYSGTAYATRRIQAVPTMRHWSLIFLLKSKALSQTSRPAFRSMIFYKPAAREECAVFCCEYLHQAKRRLYCGRKPLCRRKAAGVLRVHRIERSTQKIFTANPLIIVSF